MGNTTPPLLMNRIQLLKCFATIRILLFITLQCNAGNKENSLTRSVCSDPFHRNNYIGPAEYRKLPRLGLLSVQAESQPPHKSVRVTSVWTDVGLRTDNGEVGGPAYMSSNGDIPTMVCWCYMLLLLCNSNN